MKQIYNFLTGSLIALICFQLSLISIPTAYSASCPGYNTTDDKADIERQQACDKLSGKYWDCNRGACLTTETALEEEATIKSTFNDDAYGNEELGKTGCENEATAAKRRECYQKAAEAQTGETLDEGKYEWEQTLAQTMEGIALGVAVANYVATKKILVPKCVTLTIFNIAAIASIGSELYYYFMLKGDLDALKDAYVNNEDPFAAQMDAFKYLKDEQTILKDILFQKMIIAYALSALYYAAMISGIAETALNVTGCGDAVATNKIKDPLMEIFSSSSEVSWNIPTDFQLQNSNDSMEMLVGFLDWSNYLQGHRRSMTLNQYQQLQEADLLKEYDSKMQKELRQGLALVSQFKNFVIPAAIAGTDATDADATLFEEENGFENGLFIALLTGSVAAATMLISLIEGVKPFFAHPALLAVLSGLAGTSQVILATHYQEQWGEIDGHLTALEDIITRFEASMSEYCSAEDRENISVPKCYCYNEDGTRNTTTRGNSATCKKLWTTPGSTVKFVAGSNDSKSSAGRRGCMALNGQFDLQCKCRQFRDSSSGQNACFKANKSALNLNGIGNSLSLGAIAAGVDEMSQGNYDSGALGDQTSLQNSAARAKKIISKMAPTMKSELKKQGLPSLKTMQAGLGKVLSQADSPRYLGRFGNAMPTDAAQAAQGGAKNAAAIKNALKKTGLSKILYTKKGGKKKKKLNFNFMDENEGAKTVAKISNDGFMEKRYKIKHNDIVKNEDASIWKVISNRYNQTGLRVLFED